MADQDDADRAVKMPWWAMLHGCCTWLVVIGGLIWLIVLSNENSELEHKVDKIIKTCCAGGAAAIKSSDGHHRKARHATIEIDPEIVDAIATGNAVNLAAGGDQDVAAAAAQDNVQQQQVPPSRWSRAGAVKKQQPPPQQAKQPNAAPRTKATKK